jgi:hypothetical protein
LMIFNALFSLSSQDTGFLSKGGKILFNYIVCQLLIYFTCPKEFTFHDQVLLEYHFLLVIPCQCSVVHWRNNSKALFYSQKKCELMYFNVCFLPLICFSFLYLNDQTSSGLENRQHLALSRDILISTQDTVVIISWIIRVKDWLGGPTRGPPVNVRIWDLWDLSRTSKKQMFLRPLYWKILILCNLSSKERAYEA